MPKVDLVKDARNVLSPLRLTRRRGRTLKSGSRICPSWRVRCACCTCSLVIYYDTPVSGDYSLDSLEINGVMGTVDQWRKLFLPLLGIPPRLRNPKPAKRRNRSRK